MNPAGEKRLVPFWIPTKTITSSISRTVASVDHFM
jgi:hypothetical protein